jgi:hypothetical protein
LGRPPVEQAAGREATYPACPGITRVVWIGGLTKAQLLEQLAQHRVELNQAAKDLCASDKFTTADERSELNTVELSVSNLGFPEGAIISEIFSRALRLGLRLCPMETGPHFRLQFLDQPEGFIGHPVTQHRAPPGSIAIASHPLSDDEKFPKGFYLRRISGTLWLRGYWSGPDHVYEPEDRLLFAKV